MKRYYYISNNLDDLDQIEKELEASGVFKPQLHVLSNDDAAVQNHHHLHNIQSIFKTNVAHGMIKGAWIGLCLAIITLLITYNSSWPETYTWIPFIFLSIITLGFSTWVGGLYGIQSPHKELKQFEDQLNRGKHLFIVDLDAEQKASLDQVVQNHPRLRLAGDGRPTPRWVVMGQYNIKKFATESFP